MNPILRITDGTTHVDLVKHRGQSGFYIKDWTPLIAEAKGGGAWSDSPLAEGRQLADEKLANVVETYTVAIKGQDQDALIREDQDLLRLFEKAKAYWRTNWQTQMVWIEARSPCETNTRYAVIHYGKSPSRANPYSQPFLQADNTAVMDDLSLIIERGQWQGTEPGTGTATQVSNPGRTPTTGFEVYVGNHCATSALSHVYVDDGGAFGANLVASTAFSLLPAAPAVNDAVYFGISPVAPFSSLVFDIGTAIANVTTIVWEYCTNAAGPVFSPLGVMDNTNHDGVMDQVAFNTTGVHSVHWGIDDNWVACTINGVLGLWVRARVTVIGAGPTAPTQQNRAVYTVIWPYVEIAAAQVKGDLPALIEQKAYNQTDKVTAGSHFTGLDSRRCLCGVRSVSRGDNFRAYLNLGGSQNPAGITVAVDDALGDTTLPVLNWTPTDRSVYYDATAAGGAVGTPARRYYMNFSSAIVDEFYGTYRAFLRYMLLTAPVNGYLCMTSGDQYDPDHIRTWVSSSFTLSNASLLPNNLQVADLGKIEIGAPGALRTTDILNYVRFYLYLDSSTGLGQCYFTDLILLPIDEMSWDVQLKEPGASDTDGHVGSYVDYERYFDCDSIGYPKFQGRAWVRQAYTDQWVRALEAIVNGPFSLHSNRQQRMWFLFGNNAYSNGPYYPHEICHKVQLWHTPRYLGLRGDR